MAATPLSQYEFVSGSGQQLVVFGPAFLGPGFDSAGTRPHRIGGDQPQQLAFQGGLLADAQAAPLQHGRKGLQGVQRAFERQPA